MTVTGGLSNKKARAYNYGCMWCLFECFMKLIKVTFNKTLFTLTLYKTNLKCSYQILPRQWAQCLFITKYHSFSSLYKSTCCNLRAGINHHITSYYYCMNFKSVLILWLCSFLPYLQRSSPSLSLSLSLAKIMNPICPTFDWNRNRLSCGPSCYFETLPRKFLQKQKLLISNFCKPMYSRARPRPH